MLRRNNKAYELYTASSVDEYGYRAVGTLVDTIYCNIAETNGYAATSNPTAAESDFYALTNYRNCTPGMVLQNSDGKYRITRVVNSTRQAQLWLKSI